MDTGRPLMYKINKNAVVGAIIITGCNYYYLHHSCQGSHLTYKPCDLRWCEIPTYLHITSASACVLLTHIAYTYPVFYCREYNHSLSTLTSSRSMFMYGLYTLIYQLTHSAFYQPGAGYRGATRGNQELEQHIDYVRRAVNNKKLLDSHIQNSDSLNNSYVTCMWHYSTMAVILGVHTVYQFDMKNQKVKKWGKVTLW